MILEGGIHDLLLELSDEERELAEEIDGLVEGDVGNYIDALKGPQTKEEWYESRRGLCVVTRASRRNP